MTDFNIFGVCVLRDIFNYNTDENFTVKKYAQFISPYSLKTLDGVNIIKDKQKLEDLIDGLDTSNFKKRNLKLDINKSIFEFLSEFRADYILIDMACCRYDLYYFPEKKVYTTRNEICDAVYSGEFLDKCELIDCDILSEDAMHSALDNYCEKLLSQYNASQIILFEIKGINLLLNKSGKIVVRGTDLAQKYNRRIGKAYDYAKLKLPGCHIIEFPSNILADESHYLGYSVLHYIKEYYDYAYNAIKLIISNLPLELERIALNNLKSHYENLIYEKYSPVLSSTLSYYAEKEKTAERMTKYVKYFKELLLDGSKLPIFKNYFISNNIHHCAFYGASEISRFLIEYIQNNIPDVSVDYLIENATVADYKGIPYISRYAHEFPLTDLIIISDVMYIEAIYKKLNDMNIKAKVIDVFNVPKE